MKTAVILAARKELDSEVPYPLLPYADGVCLMDRILSVLRDLCFEHIYIVCGYKASLFQRYGDDVVEVVENKRYSYTASMASLACVRDVVKEDFLLVESDTFYERKVIESLAVTTYPDCLAITEESGNGNEAFVETKNGFVTKISKDRRQMRRFDGVMLGLMRISLPTFHAMLRLWDTTNNLFLNYEYLFMDATSPVDRPCLFFKNLIWGDVVSQEDFHKLKNYIYPRLRRKENPFDQENLLAHLQAIFPDRDVRDAAITQIGGMSNKNFKVELGDEAYVLRVPGYGSEGMVDRLVEEENSIKAASMGVNPDIRYFNKQTGVKLVDFIAGAETLNGGTIQRQENLRQVAGILRFLHHSKVRFNNDFNVFKEILKYEELLRKEKGTMYEGYEDVRSEVLGLEDLLNRYGVSLVPCHNDIVAENFVKSDTGKIFLIDWEYSGMNDPLWDVAMLFVECDFTSDSEDFLLDVYFEGDVPAYTREKILIYQILMDVLWSIWTRVKETAGDDFGSYGMDRFARAVENLRRIR